MRGGRTAAMVILGGALLLTAAGVRAAPIDDDDFSIGYDGQPRFFLDRIELSAGWGRQICDEDDGSTETAKLNTRGIRLVKNIGPLMFVGFDFGAVDRTGSRHPSLEEGTTGAFYVGMDDQDIAWSGGVTLNPSRGFPRVTGSARIGGREDLFLSASYAHSNPVFSSDDVNVGMGAGFGYGNQIWLGAAMPVNRDVVGFKAALSVKPASRLEVTGTGRYGNSRAGRIEGFSVSVAYVNPEMLEASVPGPGLGRFLAREPNRMEYVGAGGIVGAVGGVMVAGAAVQRSCGEAAFTPAVVGALVGGLLGAIFGNAMW